MPSLPASYSPAELAYLHSSLSATPPIRPDARTAAQFRPLTAETDVLPSTNGSAHLSFSDGSEAIVGVKAEVERTKAVAGLGEVREEGEDVEMQDVGASAMKKTGRGEWVELSIDISGLRDDDTLLVFLGEMMREALLSGGALTESLIINRGWHWKLYIDVLLLSPFSASSLPLPLLSLTSHLALLSSRLPAMKSQGEEDPLFEDDWAAATNLYPRQSRGKSSIRTAANTTPSPLLARPPVTLLVIIVGPNIILDPSREELAVADTVLAISLGSASSGDLHILSVRTLDTPARDTFAGVPATGQEALEKSAREGGVVGEGVWVPRCGGIKRGVLKNVMRNVVKVGTEVVDGLEGFAE